VPCKRCSIRPGLGVSSAGWRELLFGEKSFSGFEEGLGPGEEIGEPGCGNTIGCMCGGIGGSTECSFHTRSERGAS
jgi:hypothetical protein